MLIEVSSLAVSLASLIASIWIGKASVTISQRALEQAREVADRASADWRQQQWFTLFVEANNAYDLLDRLQSTSKAFGWASLQDQLAASALTVMQLKKAQGLAEVFPKCVEVDAFFEATKFPVGADYQRPEKLTTLFNAVEGLRQKALVSPDVLGALASKKGSAWRTAS